MRSIPPAQIEAARALGLTYMQAIRQVVFPQAVRNALPTLVNHSVLAVQEQQPGDDDRRGRADVRDARDRKPDASSTIEIYLLATVMYLASRC